MTDERERFDSVPPHRRATRPLTAAVICTSLVVSVLTGSAAAEAGASATALTITTVETTADKPIGTGAGASASNDGFVLLSNGNVSWADPNCASLIGRTVGVSTVPWATIGNATRTDFTCAQLQGMTAAPTSLPPVSAGANGAPNYSPVGSTTLASLPVTAILQTQDKNTVGTGQDAWADVNGNRVWLPGSCVTQLTLDAVPVVTVNWNQISAMPQIATPDCSSMDPGSGNRLGAADTEGSILLVTPDMLLSRDGFLLNPNGQKQWVDATCVQTLVAAAIPIRVTAWNDIAGLATDPTPLPCSAINVVAVPLQQTGSGPITPDDGGKVTSSDGVVLAVPAGAVSSPTTGTITAMSNGAWDVHINQDGWTGTVQVTLPTGGGVSHQVAGQFLPEGDAPGQQTVTVSSLSLFGKAKMAVQTALCLEQIAPPAIAFCVASKLLLYADRKLATELIRWVVAKVGNAIGLNACVQTVVVKAITLALDSDPRLLVAFAKDAKGFLQTLLTGPCTGNAGSGGNPPPTTGTSTGLGSPPAPIQVSAPAPVPAPAPAPAPSIGQPSVGKGASAQGRSGCSSQACAYLTVDFSAMGGGTRTVQCWISGSNAPYYSYTTSNSRTSVCYAGYPGRGVWAVVSGIRSNTIIW